MASFTPTPVDSIASTVTRLDAAFGTLKSHPLSFRLEQLGRLYWGLRDNEQALYDALAADIGKPVFETFMTEFAWPLSDIVNVMENLKTWAADEPITDVPWTTKLVNRPVMRKDPMGTILIIGASNFPVQLTISPLVGAIAGGNAAVVKPSELTPRSSALIAKIVEDVLDSEFYAVVNGGVDVTTKLLELKFDKIVYTGSTYVGKIVATAAAKHLTPCILELGGLNPVFVTKSADVKTAAKRIAWGKVHNAGQICLGPDYVLIHPSLEREFVESFKNALKIYLPNGAQASPDYGKIVNDRNFNRIKKLLDNSSGTVLCGGSVDESTRFIEPTLVKVTNSSDSLLSEEIFGPVIPMMVVGKVDEMVLLAKRLGDTPLAMYIFSADKLEQEKILKSVRSGGVSINDVILHASNSYIPFGGVGESGHGKYRGRDTFDSFVHRRPILSQPLWVEGQLSIRYPPYTPKKLAAYKRFVAHPAVKFGRDGKHLPQSLWLWAFLLGSSNKKGGVFRYLLVVLAGVLWARKFLPGAKA
ncbi:aldehyde dehydrogenase [Morchella conica CCBAS932]|uniref:Aldehyde dehydrogenase n=1 Tax=Morchella conica CCBAS932 TaxID=1392247 RepID=A0A3N4KVU1_9PEZI|nr:aldehyde dehydrogenase [Morchella conica CCBAS932]